MSDTTTPIGEIILAIQAKLTVPKERYNDFSDFYYRSADDILRAIKPLLANYGLLPHSTNRVEQRGEHSYQVATVSILDKSLKIIMTSEAWAREDKDRKKMDAPQLSGSAASYATKRAWGNLLGIDDTKDSDATNVQEHTATKDPVLPSPKPDPVAQPAAVFKYSLGVYADKSNHVMLIDAFNKMESRQNKVLSLEDMMQYLEEVIPLPDYKKATLQSLDSYCRLFLSTLHNQEANKLMVDAVKKGVSVEDAMKVFESKGVEPRVVNHIDLKQKEEKVDQKTGYVQPDLSYI